MPVGGREAGNVGLVDRKTTQHMLFRFSAAIQYAVVDAENAQSSHAIEKPKPRKASNDGGMTIGSTVSGLAVIH